MDFSGYQQAWNDSFSFDFVPREQLEPLERAIIDRAGEAAALAGLDLGSLGVAEVAVSKTMRLAPSGDPVLGVWESEHRRVVIRRDQLASPRSFYGTLLHELGHARSGAPDRSLAFEDELSRLLGTVTAAGLERSP
jgi:hypothetical protein